MEDIAVKVLLIGDEEVGKTTFLSRISRGSNNLEGHGSITLLRDIDQPFVFEIRNRRRGYRIEFYDTSSPEDWRLLEPDLILICYDISQRSSLVNMQRLWIKQVHATFQASDRIPLIVVGLKRDLRSESDPNGIIYPQEAYNVSQEMRVDKYVECSAVTGELLKLAFEEICDVAVKTATPDGGQTEGGCVIL
ncbi:P-loop containing nucleoside triphosphate hydrolase protein [Hypoxylon fragiforme]|uniref:P-loop containing nucleoside triphosphate hydrolase protein n=1 Tax=Hypoxylon fragiforme TaxID=63214 RepID=UPI0020C5E89C|nr:P-loop containing nucleoside triphosphate hydrolase protein [Hypoxylon fragiforme]KAI2611107.1 P-loop containing nucleoside triphosphate hydrolase protein [Hypoxylon fragiforme]